MMSVPAPHAQVQPSDGAHQNHIHHDHELHPQHLEHLQTQQMHNQEALVGSSGQYELWVHT
uniref:Serine/arginine-rich-splicing factor SR34-like n=1 Tax=Rhizophora mucronata TaxID=61149 RepID=A0A2P2LUW7_RHIMU